MPSRKAAYKFALALFISCYVGIHLYLLDVSPLPWFDETYFASIAKSWLESGTLQPKVALADGLTEQPVYGPIYFWLLGASFKLFGFGIWQLRLVSLLSGFCVIIAAAKLFRLFGASTKLQITLGVILSLDPFFNRSMHEGRMDLLALFFLLMASYFQIKHWENSSGKKDLLFSAIFATMALLTTPRSGFFLVGFVFLHLYLIIKRSHKVADLLIWCAIIFGFYSIWVVEAFGGYRELLAFYERYTMFLRTNPAKTAISVQQYPLIFLGVISAVYGTIKFRREYWTIPIILFASSIVLFYSIVFDQGPYAVFIIPSYYLLIFKLLQLELRAKNVRIS